MTVIIYTKIGGLVVLKDVLVAEVDSHSWENKLTADHHTDVPLDDVVKIEVFP